jgi:hypothetical protein
MLEQLLLFDLQLKCGVSITLRLLLLSPDGHRPSRCCSSQQHVLLLVSPG